MAELAGLWLRFSNKQFGEHANVLALCAVSYQCATHEKLATGSFTKHVCHTKQCARQLFAVAGEALAIGCTVRSLLSPKQDNCSRT